MIRTTIYLTEDQVKLLRERAREQGVSVSHLVRQGIDMMLSSSITDAEKRKRAKEAAGIVSSGVADLSVRHDEYLADAYGH